MQLKRATFLGSCAFLSVVTTAGAAGSLDQYGCPPPPEPTTQTLGIEASLASVKILKLALGELSVKTDPNILELASKTATDAYARSYIRCLALARDHFTSEQVAYLDVLNAFLTTKPTADQFIAWQDKHPSPNVDPLVRLGIASHALTVVEAGTLPAGRTQQSLMGVGPCACAGGAPYSSPKATIPARVGEAVSFFIDGSNICHGLSVAGVKTTVHWSPEISDTTQEAWGKATVTFARVGLHNINFEVQAVCQDCAKQCAMGGSTSVEVK